MPRKKPPAVPGVSASPNRTAYPVIIDQPPHEISGLLRSRRLKHNTLTLMAELAVIDRVMDDLVDRYENLLSQSTQTIELPDGTTETVDALTPVDQMRFLLQFAQNIIDLTDSKGKLAKIAIENSAAVEATITPDRVPAVVDRILSIVLNVIQNRVPKAYHDVVRREIADELRAIADQHTRG